MKTSADSITVRHREFVQDIQGSEGFTLDAFAVNPGNPLLFPWLSSIAQRYESYTFRELHFEYETSVSTITPGTVMLAADYDVTDPAPLTKVQLMSYSKAERGAPWQETRYDARPSDLRKFAAQRYVRGLALPSGDPKTYDVANIFVATQGMSAPVVTVGELYVSYTVVLQTPQISSALQVAGSAQITGAGVFDENPFGSAPIISANPYELSILDNVVTTQLVLGKKYVYCTHWDASTPITGTILWGASGADSTLLGTILTANEGSSFTEIIVTASTGVVTFTQINDNADVLDTGNFLLTEVIE